MVNAVRLMRARRVFKDAPQKVGMGSQVQLKKLKESSVLRVWKIFFAVVAVLFCQ